MSAKKKTKKTKEPEAGLKTWNVTARVVASHYAGEVEAATGEEAIEKARDKASVSVCWQCAEDISDPELDNFVAECGDEVVKDDECLTWEERARAAGWTPPRAEGKKAKS